MSPCISSRILKRFLIGFISLLILALLVLWIIDVTAKRRWTAYVEDLKNRGVPTTYEEVIKTDVPADQNAAVLWEQAVAEPWVVPKEGPVLSLNDYTELDRAGVLVPATPEFRTAILVELEANAAFIETLKRIVACPYFAFKPKSVVHAKTLKDLEPLIPGATSRPNLRESSSVTERYKFLSKAIAVLVQEGQTDRAFDLLVLGLNSSRHYTESPCSGFAFLCGISIRGTLAKASTEVLRKVNLSQDQSKTLIGLLDPIKMRPGYRQAVNAQRVWSVEECGERLKAGWSAENLSGYMGFWRDIWEKLQFSFTKWFFIGKRIELNEVFLENNQILDGPSSQWLKVGSNDENGHGIQTEVEILFRTECRLQILRLGIAAKAYRKEHGDWPANLTALVPDYFTSLPADPFTDGAFCYQVVEKSIKIFRLEPGSEEYQPVLSPSSDEGDRIQVFAPGPS